MCLKPSEIQLVEDYVKQANISHSHLAYDLTDHICCSIESQLAKGSDFRTAFSKIQAEVGVSGLRKVQTETLFLIDKNYRTMKKSMKVLGAIALAMMAIAALFKIQHWPGAGILLTLSFATVVFFFYPSALYVMYRDLNQRKKAWYFIISYIGGVGFMLGTLFKIQHWPGANILLLLGTVLISFLIIPIKVLNQDKKANIKGAHKPLLFSVGVLLIGILFKILHWPGASVLIISGNILIWLGLIIYFIGDVRKDNIFRIDFVFSIIFSLFLSVLSSLFVLNLSNAISYDLSYQEQANRHNIALIEQSTATQAIDSSFIELSDLQKEINEEIYYLKSIIVKESSKGKAQVLEPNSDKLYSYSNMYGDIPFLYKNHRSLLNKLQNHIDEYKMIVEKNEFLNMKQKKDILDLLNYDETSLFKPRHSVKSIYAVNYLSLLELKFSLVNQNLNSLNSK